MKSIEIEKLLKKWKAGDSSAGETLYGDMSAIVLKAIKDNLGEISEKKAIELMPVAMSKAKLSLNDLDDASKYMEWLEKIAVETIEEAKGNDHASYNEKKTTGKAISKSKEEVSRTKTTGVKSHSWKKKISKLSRTKKIGGICVIILVLFALFFFLSAQPTIDMNKYATVEFSGYDGYGTASVTINWDQLSKDYKGKIKYTDKANQEYRNFFGNYAKGTTMDSLTSGTETLRMAVSVDIETKSQGNLLNGDEVTLKWKESNSISDLNVKIKDDDKKIKVNGLTKVKKVDVFKDLDVTFEGVNGNGTANIASKIDGYTYYFNVDADSYSLSNGEKITVSIPKNNLETFVRNYGEKPEKTSKEYTVKGLTKYVETASDISDDLLAKMKEQSEDIFREIYSGNSNVSVSTPEYHGFYILKNKSNGSWYSNNIVGLVYKYTATGIKDDEYFGNVGESRTGYCVMKFENLTVNEDGNSDDNLADKGTMEYQSFYDSDMRVNLYGYEDLNSAYSDIVDGNAKQFTAEWNVAE